MAQLERRLSGSFSETLPQPNEIVARKAVNKNSLKVDFIGVSKLVSGNKDRV